MWQIFLGRTGSKSRGRKLNPSTDDKPQEGACKDFRVGRGGNCSARLPS